VLNWLELIYQRWLAQRDGLAADPSDLEVKAAGLAAGWPSSQAALVGLPDVQTASSFTQAGSTTAMSSSMPPAQPGRGSPRLGRRSSRLPAISPAQSAPVVHMS